MSINPEDDFQGYMEDVERRRSEQERVAEMLARHEQWRQTTWGGFAVRQLQAIGKHMAPFFLAVSDVMNADDNSFQHILLLIVIRAVAIGGFVAIVLGISSAVNKVFSREIVIEQEIVIEEYDDGENKRVTRSAARKKKKKEQ